jgi:hypothetical protein
MGKKRPIMEENLLFNNRSTGYDQTIAGYKFILFYSINDIPAGGKKDLVV